MCADTHGKRRLMGVLKCCSEWCRNFSYLRISVRSVFQKWGKIFIIQRLFTIPFSTLVLFTLFVGGDLFKSKVSFVSINKVLFQEDESILCKVKNSCACDRFSIFFQDKLKGGFPKSNKQKKQFCIFFIFFYVKRASAQDCWPPHAALHFPGQSEINSLNEQLALQREAAL